MLMLPMPLGDRFSAAAAAESGLSSSQERKDKVREERHHLLCYPEMIGYLHSPPFGSYLIRKKTNTVSPLTKVFKCPGVSCTWAGIPLKPPTRAKRTTPPQKQPPAHEMCLPSWIVAGFAAELGLRLLLPLVACRAQAAAAPAAAGGGLPEA